jgi:hypothetical protein
MAWYVVSLLVFGCGMALAARNYPGGYDWCYTVVSALASQKNNPAGGIWFSGALSVSMGLLLPYVSTIKQGLPAAFSGARVSIPVLRLGAACGALVGIEKLLFRDISSWIDKSHELVALITFLSLYAGVLGLLLPMLRRNRRYLLPVLLVGCPLLAVGISEFWLYLAQREVGWLNTSWRDTGLPLWLSFAFWQWLAVVFLWLGMGMLVLTIADDER